MQRLRCRISVCKWRRRCNSGDRLLVEIVVILVVVVVILIVVVVIVIVLGLAIDEIHRPSLDALRKFQSLLSLTLARPPPSLLVLPRDPWGVSVLLNGAEAPHIAWTRNHRQQRQSPC